MKLRAAMALLLAAGLSGCPKGNGGASSGGSTPPSPIDTLDGHGSVGQDTTPKEQERLVKHRRPLP